jgi:hypothetical protein
MIRKIVATDLTLLQAVLSFLQQNKILLDYALPMLEVGRYTQIIRVKCDDTALNGIIQKKFKKQIRILK